MLVETNENTRQAMQCAIDLTTNAKTSLLKWFQTEQSFFTVEKQFHVFIEKRPENRQGNTSYYLYFHNETNEKLREALSGRVAILECVIDNQALLAIGFQVRSRREVIETNRRYETNLKFVLNQRQTAASLPIDLYTALRSLPVAEERSAYVEKRISSWEGYLKIQELNANVEDIETTYEQAFIHDEETKLTITCPQLNAKTIRQIEGFSANIAGLSGDIGQVTAVKTGQKALEISLSKQYQRQAKRHDVNFQQYKTITFNNFAELSQVRRLRKGFKDLQHGLAANPNLEKVLFEERPVVKITNQKQSLQFHSRLNDYQREAVEGAMNAHDLYVIQGPPGTGKTTVIAEICYQNAKAGLKTLVASQANLAVDNALGRLLNDPDIRILRYGRTESIEEEGRKFIEENVAEHWKDQTVEQIENALADISANKESILTQCAELQRELEMLQEQYQHTEKLVEEKQVAVQRLKDILADQQQQTDEENRITDILNGHRQTVEQLHEKHHQLLKRIEQLSDCLRQNEVTIKEETELIAHKETCALLEQSILYANLAQQLEQLRADQQDVLKKQERYEKEVTQMEGFIESSMNMIKFPQLMEAVQYYQLGLSDTLQLQLEKLDRDIFIVKEKMSQYEKKDWELVDERLVKAIPMLEDVLKQQGFYSEEMHRRPVRYQFTSADDVHQFLNRMGAFLVQPKTKEMLATRNFSGEKFDALERIADAYVLLRNTRAQIRYEHRELQTMQQEAAMCKERFEQLKGTIIQTITIDISERQEKSNALSERLEAIRLQIDEHEQTIADMDVSMIRQEELNQLIEERTAIHRVIEQMEEQQRQYTDAQAKMETAETELKEVIAKEQHLHEQIQQLEHNLETIQTTLRTLSDERKEVEKVTATSPETLLEELVQKQENVQSTLTRQEQALAQYPVKEQVQKQWLMMLKEASDYDLQEIKNLYIEHANVIGTTCVASARKEFIDTYPTFDVVIIDEVSKATPPELLLPMLKGKKVILVGDHHQLPPLIGQETMEEFLETVENTEDRHELAKLLQESLFERLFRTLPKQNKTMLGIQYRMHETIMNTITPFYNDGDYTLQCGLENADEQRDHLLESEHIARTDRLLWFNLPNEKPYFEERVKGGTSRFNAAELAYIRTLLIELNEATAQAIADGRMVKGAKKHIGIISFYGEQVKRINRLIEHELHLPYLHCRTGSVDKFQGMEMDVILLSFVRNHDHPSGDIGFAKDYRRLNVALSRAKELLMIIGSSEMFTKRPKQATTRKMFERLATQIEQQNGMKQLPLEVNV